VLKLEEGIGVRTLEKIELNSQGSIYDYLNQNFSLVGENNSDQFPPSQSEKIRVFIRKINRGKEKLSTELPLTDFLPTLLADFNY
jgi:hypothetical protein